MNSIKGRTVGVVTSARSDYGIYLSVLRKIEKDPDLDLCLYVTGIHLSPEFGSTVREIEADGFEIKERIEMLLSSDTPVGVAKSIGLGIIGFAEAFSRLTPDILLVLGDRFEMFAAVSASLPFNIPVAHIHGGESTEGLIDEPIRHSITKMSHLHFPTTEFYARRIIGMGEEPWRVIVSGAPSLDKLKDMRLLDKKEIKERFDIDLSKPTLLITYHPVTLRYRETEIQMKTLLSALNEVGMNLIFTYPNADTSGRKIIEMINEFAEGNERVHVAKHFGAEVYFSLMSHVTAMVGNSSSGIVEAASFKLPVVNIGDRQRGRIHGENVIDTGYDKDGIVAAIKKAASDRFKAGLENLVNPYGQGDAAEIITEKLKSVEIDDGLLLKRFYDIGSQGK